MSPDTPDAAKRTAERLAIHGALRAEIMVFQPLLIREISIKGAAIDTSFPLHIDSLHDVRLTLGNVSLVVKGRVANSHVTDVGRDTVTYRSGLEFIELAEPALNVMTMFIEELKKNHGRA